MSAFVVDASVAVKWFFPEVHEADALRLIHGRHDLLVPDVFFSEFGNALWKRLRRRETTTAVAAGFPGHRRVSSKRRSCRAVAQRKTTKRRRTAIATAAVGGSGRTPE